MERRLFVSVNPFHARHVRENRTYHERFRSGRTAGRPGGVGQGCVPTDAFANETRVPLTRQGIEEKPGGVGQDCMPAEFFALGRILSRTFQSIYDTSLERFFRSTNKRNPIETSGGSKPLVDNWFITVLTLVHRQDEKLSFPLAADQWTDVVFCKPIHAKHVRECRNEINS